MQNETNSRMRWQPQWQVMLGAMLTLQMRQRRCTRSTALLSEVVHHLQRHNDALVYQQTAPICGQKRQSSGKSTVMTTQKQ
jgi:hypothetical protein